MKKKKIIIELAEDIPAKLVEKRHPTDLEHPAFNDFTVRIPALSFYGKDTIIEKLSEEVGADKAKIALDGVLKSWFLDIETKITEDNVTIRLYDELLKETTVHVTFPYKIFMLPIIKSSKADKESSELLSYRLYNIASGVLYNLDSFNYQVVESREKDRSKKNKKNKKHSNRKTNVSYIYTKKYLVKDIGKAKLNELEDDQRMYTKESWSVKGFWRTSKNGVRTWIKPQVRRRKGLSGKSNSNEDVRKFNKVLE